MRRAMSCVYWAPKSRIRIRWAWMSALGAGAWLACGCALPRAPDVRSLAASRDAVIGRLLGDRDVVHVALAYARTGNAHEARSCAHFLDVVTARIAHRRTQTASQLVEDRDQAPLVGYASLDALGHELLELARRVLKVAVRRAMTL